jgi:hypothetical protein
MEGINDFIKISFLIFLFYIIIYFLFYIIIYNLRSNLSDDSFISIKYITTKIINMRCIYLFIGYLTNLIPLIDYEKEGN